MSSFIKTLFNNILFISFLPEHHCKKEKSINFKYFIYIMFKILLLYILLIHNIQYELKIFITKENLKITKFFTEHIKYF